MTIDVEIEHRYFRHLLEIAPGARGHISLTTLIPRQHHAVIKLFLFKNSKHILLGEYLLDLSPFGRNRPLIEVRGKAEKHTLELSITVEKKIVEEDTLKIPTPCSIGRGVFLFTAGCILLAVFLFFGYRYIHREAAPVTVTEPPPARTAAPPAVQPPVKPEIKPSVKPAPFSYKRIIYFYPDSTRIKKGEETKVQEVITILKNHSSTRVTISGFCALSGTLQGREVLSKNRAEKVASLLKKAGGLSEKSLHVVWFGAKKPITTDPAQIDKNRRVEIEIVSN